MPAPRALSVSLVDRFRALRSSAAFWSLRAHDETRELLAVRQDTVEPPHLSADRGAMLSAVTEGGYGYCATSPVKDDIHGIIQVRLFGELMQGHSFIFFKIQLQCFSQDLPPVIS